MVMSLVASNVRDPQEDWFNQAFRAHNTQIGGFTKKATCSVMIFVGYAVGQIIAPQFFRASESPSYPTGFRAFYVSTGLMIVIQISLL